MKQQQQGHQSRKKSNRAVESGDRFKKVTDVLESTGTVWLVSHVLDLPGMPPHVRIVDEQARYRAMTLAVSALLDKRLYRRLEASPASPPVTILSPSGDNEMDDEQQGTPADDRVTEIDGVRSSRTASDLEVLQSDDPLDPAEDAARRATNLRVHAGGQGRR